MLFNPSWNWRKDRKSGIAVFHTKAGEIHVSLDSFGQYMAIENLIKAAYETGVRDMHARVSSRIKAAMEELS